MDTGLNVSNVTELVIAMEVPVIKAAHCALYHSHSNVSRLCVEMLTRQIPQHTRHTRDPTNASVPARDETVKTL